MSPTFVDLMILVSGLILVISIIRFVQIVREEQRFINLAERRKDVSSACLDGTCECDIVHKVEYCLWTISPSNYDIWALERNESEEELHANTECGAFLKVSDAQDFCPVCKGEIIKDFA